MNAHLHKQLAAIAARIRERAVQDRTFTAEVAADVEELAYLASKVAEMTARVEDAVATIEEALEYAVGMDS
jgi:hypothetical protein